MNQKTGLTIAAGCVVLLCLCIAIFGIAFFMLGVPNRLTEISQGLGGEVTPSPPMMTLLPPAVGTRVPTVPAAGVPTKAAPAPTSAPSVPSSGNPLVDFLNKTQTATKYRVEFKWIFGGTEQGKYQEVPFFDMRGYVDGDNTYLASKGGLVAMLSGDQNATIEFIQANGKAYVKGLTLFGLADPKQWYIADDSMSSSFRDFANPDEFKDYVEGRDSDFKKVRTELLDGQSCDVWMYDFKNAQAPALASALTMAKDKSDFGVIEVGQASVWLCSDGFIHKWMFEVRGHDAKNPNEKGTLMMSAHMWDFNNPTIVVTAPPNAKPMPGR